MWGRRDPLSPRVLHRECRAILDGMPLPEPFTMAGFIANIEKVRGRQIRLVELPADVPGHTGACGLWIKHRERPLDLILHVGDIPKFHRKKIVLHELAHLWLGDGEDTGAAVTRDQLGDLVPGMPAQAVDRLFASGAIQMRGGYTTHAEARAETLADLLAHAARDALITDDAPLRNLEESLSRPIAGPRRPKDHRG
ncbi:hypothetical protein OK074_4953 [Actinobacteria bacterium OK074]|nr:hypothetical protein OK074_4953 [Actinobacteria bacterium OK074]